MADVSTITSMAFDLNIHELALLKNLLDRKLQTIPEHHLPAVAIDDIFQQAPRVLYISTLPADLQLPYFLRNRSLINNDNERPIKDESKQPLKLTRAIFFYHLSKVYQFQRFHDMARWNIAIFIALLSTPTTSTTSSVRGKPFPTSKSGDITPAARRFMITYLTAVMERHNTPTVFDKREEFIKRWKDSRIDLFTAFKTAQKKLLKKAVQRLNREWEHELDRAMKTMGRKQYDSCVASFVGSIVHGRTDQALPQVAYTPVRDFTRSASPSPEARGDMRIVIEHQELMEGKNELLEALRVPLEDRKYQDDDRHQEELEGPVDVKAAIAAVQDARPADMLVDLMRMFPGQGGEGKV